MESKALINAVDGCLRKKFQGRMDTSSFATLIAQDPNAFKGINFGEVIKFWKRLSKIQADPIKKIKKKRPRGTGRLEDQFEAIEMQLRSFQSNPDMLNAHNTFIQGVQIPEPTDPKNIEAVGTYCNNLNNAIGNMELSVKYFRFLIGKQISACVNAHETAKIQLDVIKALSQKMGVSTSAVNNNYAYYKVVKHFPILLFSDKACYSFIYLNVKSIQDRVLGNGLHALYCQDTPDINIQLEPIQVPALHPMEVTEEISDYTNKEDADINPIYLDGMEMKGYVNKTTFVATLGEDYLEMLENEYDGDDDEDYADDEDDDAIDVEEDDVNDEDYVVNKEDQKDDEDDEDDEDDPPGKGVSPAPSSLLSELGRDLSETEL